MLRTHQPEFLVTLNKCLRVVKCKLTSDLTSVELSSVCHDLYNILSVVLKGIINVELVESYKGDDIYTILDLMPNQYKNYVFFKFLYGNRRALIMWRDSSEKSKDYSLDAKIILNITYFWFRILEELMQNK